MFSFILHLFGNLPRRQEARRERKCWSKEPLDHPDIAAMDPRQLADLPHHELRERAC